MGEEHASAIIDTMLGDLGDWRADALSTLRSWIKRADPHVLEELKWKKPSNPAGVPVWSDAGMICTGEIYRDHVKLTFAKGAMIDDPEGLFDAGPEGSVRRAIDVHEGGLVDEAAFTALVRSAVELNRSRRSP